MAQDHAKANDELARLAKQDNVPLPRDLDHDHKATHDYLGQLSGAQFDLAYLQALRRLGDAFARAVRPRASA